MTDLKHLIGLLLAATFAAQCCFAVPVEDANMDRITTLAPNDHENNALVQSEKIVPSSFEAVASDESAMMTTPAAPDADSPDARPAEGAAPTEAAAPAEAAAPTEAAAPAEAAVTVAAPVEVHTPSRISVPDKAHEVIPANVTDAPTVSTTAAGPGPAKNVSHGNRVDLLCRPSGQFEYGLNNHMHYMVHMINMTEMEAKSTPNLEVRGMDNHIYCRYANNAELNEANFQVYQVWVAKNLTNVHRGPAQDRTVLELITIV